MKPERTNKEILNVAANEFVRDTQIFGPANYIKGESFIAGARWMEEYRQSSPVESKDKQRLDWIQSVMYDDRDYIEIYLSGLRNFKKGHAQAYQIESNPWSKFMSLQAPNVREAIDKAMDRCQPWQTGSPPENGKYKVMVIMCDNPYETAIKEDEFKDGYWQGYAQFVEKWQPLPELPIEETKDK